SASTKDSSSSTTSTVSSPTSALLLVVDDRHRPVAARQHQAEGGALALAALHHDLAPMVGGHVAHDGQAQPRAARVAAAGPVDPVEALEDALEVAAGDADALVRHDQVDRSVLGVGPDLHDG